MRTRARVPELRDRLFEGLKSGGRESGGKEATRFRSGLIVCELALSTALLIGALLMVKSFIVLQAVEPGFRSDGVMTTELSLRGVGEDASGEWVVLGERLAACSNRNRESKPSGSPATCRRGKVSGHGVSCRKIDRKSWARTLRRRCTPYSATTSVPWACRSARDAISPIWKNEVAPTWPS